MPEPQVAFTEILGQVIRRHRQAKEITQEIIAPRLEMTASGLSRIESGQTPLTVVQLRRIAQSLGARASDLIREAEDLALSIPAASPGVRIVDERRKGSTPEVTGWFLGGAAIGALVATILGGTTTDARPAARSKHRRPSK